jgi:hypothetical protein
MAHKDLSENNGTNEFIKLEPIIEILRAAIWSGKIADERPVSLMLVARQESAKTECLKHFFLTPSLKYLSDLTSRGLNPYRQEIETGRIRHIVLLDLVRILSHGRGVSDRTIQSIASLMEEGESETSDGGGKSSWDNFPKIGVLMGITPEFFFSKRGRWRGTGFLTRFVPISFEYSKDTQHAIHDAIAKGHRMPPPIKENIPLIPFQIELPDKYAGIISRRAEELGITMKTYGFRYQRVLRALAKANAGLSRRGIVGDEDIGKVLAWSQYFTEKAVTL